MRIRQVKPEFWKDPIISSLSTTARLTYIGLWMLADDAGYLAYDPPTIALELYGWDGRTKRERTLAQSLEALTLSHRVVVLGCGEHAVIPTLKDHQRFAGETKRVYTFKRAHDNCPQVPAGTRGSPPVPATVSIGKVSKGTVRSVSVNAREREDEELSEFQRRVPRVIA